MRAIVWTLRLELILINYISKLNQKQFINNDNESSNESSHLSKYQNQRSPINHSIELVQ